MRKNTNFRQVRKKYAQFRKSCSCCEVTKNCTSLCLWWITGSRGSGRNCERDVYAMAASGNPDNSCSKTIDLNPTFSYRSKLNFSLSNDVRFTYCCTCTWKFKVESTCEAKHNLRKKTKTWNYTCAPFPA